MRRRATSASQLVVHVRPESEVVVHGQSRRRSGVSWATKPTRASCAGSSLGWFPDTSIVPALGVSSPTARCNSVVLPAPFGPTRPTTWPDGMSRSHWLRAQRRP